MELNEQTLRQILEEQRGEYQRYIGVVAEDFKSQVKLVVEALAGMQEQLTALRDMVARNTEDIEMIKVDIEIMKSELAIIRRDLKEKVGRDEIAVLEARVAKLEQAARTKSR